MKIIKETCYKGTRILVGNTKREKINECIKVLVNNNFKEVIIPVIQLKDIFKDKVGEENNNLMYSLTDRGGRDLCLAPEYTAVIQKLATTTYGSEKDVLLFYVQECFRGEKPQAGRFRQFTQLGVEILNPTTDHTALLAHLSLTICDILNLNLTYKYESGVTRGLDYYSPGSGFEIVAEDLGSSKQVCGGGTYEGGIGFAVGVDRILNY